MIKILDITSKYGKIFIKHRVGGKKKQEIVYDYQWYFFIKTKDKNELLPVKKFLKKATQFGPDYIKVFCNNSDLNKWDLEAGKIDEKSIVIKHLLGRGVATFEADHPLWKRYLIDEDLEIDDNPVINFLDIETDDSKNGIEIGRDQILSFASHINGKSYFYCDDDEKKVLLKIKAAIEYSDIVCGWNSQNFDVLYILARFQLHGIEFYKNNIVHFDLMEIFKKRYKFSDQEPLTNFNLEYICQKFLGRGKIKHSEKIKWLYDNDRKRLGEYNKEDVQLLHDLNSKLGILDLIKGVCKESGTPYRYYYTSEYIDNFILKEAKKDGIILASNMWKLENREGASDKKKFSGGLVLDPTVGLHNNMEVYDLNSQYPNAMITFNISSEVFLGMHKPNHDDWIKTPNGCYFLRSKKGIIPSILERLLKTRDEQKVKMKEFSKDSSEYKVLDNQQQITKLIMNSIFGIVGSEFTRYFNNDVAEAITLSSQYIIKWIHKYVTLHGYSVHGSDTDSIFMKKNE